MTQQLTRPPAHVWDRIEKILDEQDYGKNYTDKILSDTFRIPKSTRRASYFLATVAGISLLSLIMLRYSTAFKKQFIN